MAGCGTKCGSLWGVLVLGWGGGMGLYLPVRAPMCSARRITMSKTWSRKTMLLSQGQGMVLRPQGHAPPQPHPPACPPLSLPPSPQAVRKMVEAKKLESSLTYDSSFGEGK